MVVIQTIELPCSSTDERARIMGFYSFTTLSLAAVSAAAQTMQLKIPDAPPAGTQTLSGSFQGYSMEVASFADLAGNLTYGFLTLTNR